MSDELARLRAEIETSNPHRSVIIRQVWNLAPALLDVAEAAEGMSSDRLMQALYALCARIREEMP